MIKPESFWLPSCLWNILVTVWSCIRSLIYLLCNKYLHYAIYTLIMAAVSSVRKIERWTGKTCMIFGHEIATSLECSLNVSYQTVSMSDHALSTLISFHILTIYHTMWQWREFSNIWIFLLALSLTKHVLKLMGIPLSSKLWS